MQDLSLHLLDIAQNSIRAKASLINITINEDITNNRLFMKIEDNGTGMAESLLQKVTDPFVTTRTLRKVGLGLSLLKQNCQLCGGNLAIKSKLGVGTKVEAWMDYDNIDRLPLGDMASTLYVLLQGNPKIDIIYKHNYQAKQFLFSTIEIKHLLQDVSIHQIEVLAWLKSYIQENIQQIRG